MVLQLPAGDNQVLHLDTILTDSGYGVDTTVLSYTYTKVKEGV